MKKRMKIPTLFLYFLGIFLVGFGIPLMIKADLGITVVTSFPYALYEVFGLFSVGMWVTIYQCVILLLAVIILKRFTVSMLASFITAYLLGLTIDLMTLALQGLTFDSFVIKMLIVIAGSCLIGIGAGTLIFSAYPPVPDLVFIRDIAKAKNIGLTKMKVVFDSVFFVLTVSLTFFALGHIFGIGWGTLVSISIIGFVVGQTDKWLGLGVQRLPLFTEEKEHRFLEFNLLSLLKNGHKKTTD